jgi:hypothetical protein
MTAKVLPFKAKQPPREELQRAWAGSRIVIDPEGVLTIAELERDYLMWCSDRRFKADYAGIGKMLTDTGNVKRRLQPTRFEGIALLPVPDSGYRVPHQRATEAPPSHGSAGVGPGAPSGGSGATEGPGEATTGLPGPG